MKRLAFLLLYLILWLPALTQAQLALHLSADHPKISASGHLAWLREKAGQPTLDARNAVLMTANWQPLPKAVSAGYTADTIWLKLTIRRDLHAPENWVLSFSNALIDDVVLYRQNKAGTWIPMHSGEDVGRTNWKVDARNVVLPLHFMSTEPETLLIRLKTKNAMSTELDIWQQAAYENYSHRENLYFGLYFGCYLLLILFHAFFWRMTQEAQSGWYLSYVAINVTVEVLTFALPQQIFDMPVWLSDPMLGTSICASLAIGTKFALLQLELPTLWPRFSKALVLGTTGVALIGSGLIVSGDYGAGVTVAQKVAMLLVVVFIAIALRLLAKGHKPARFYLLAFGIFYAGVLISFLRNLSVIPPNIFTNYASAIGTMIHMLLMSLRLNGRYETLRKEKAAAQAQVIQTIRAFAEELERKVQKRTTDLRLEIVRRKALERELRSTLATERRIKEEQRYFVAMVSHEFRTPLAIISTTAQQIAKNPSALWEKTLLRCKNLRDATSRMFALVDEYLAADRMDADSPTFKPEPCNPSELLNGIVDEWPEDKVRMEHDHRHSPLICDSGLIKIALRNLLANADRHTPPGATILLQASETAGNGLTVRVSNSGKAIPEEEIPHLFRKYFRGKHAQHRPGAGLGLHLVQRIATMHGGAIHLESSGVNGIVTFCLTLPGGLQQN